MSESEGSGSPENQQYDCADHPRSPAVARCVTCGRLLCPECVVEREKMYCYSCAPPVWTRGPAAPPEEPPEFVTSKAEPPAAAPPPPGLPPVPPPVMPPAGAASQPRRIQLDFARAFTYIVDDPKWVSKFLLGVLCCLGSVLIVPFFILLGYELEVVRSVASGRDRTLPEWDRLGHKLKEGAQVFVVALVYSLPYLLLLGATMALGFISGGEFGSGLHALVKVFAVLLFAFGWVLVLAAGLALRLVTPAIMGTFALTRDMGKTLDFKALYGTVRGDIQRYLLVLVLTWLVTGFIASLGFLFCCVGFFFTWFYATLVNAHFFGQLARSNPAFLNGEQGDAR